MVSRGTARYRLYTWPISRGEDEPQDGRTAYNCLQNRDNHNTPGVSERRHSRGTSSSPKPGPPGALLVFSQASLFSQTHGLQKRIRIPCLHLKSTSKHSRNAPARSMGEGKKQIQGDSFCGGAPRCPQSLGYLLYLSTVCCPFLPRKFSSVVGQPEVMDGM